MNPLDVMFQAFTTLIHIAFPLKSKLMNVFLMSLCPGVMNCSESVNNTVQQYLEGNNSSKCS